LRSGYYHYRKHRYHKPVAPEHQALLGFVKELSDKSKQTYGSRRMEKALNALGYPVGRNKTKQLMKEAGELWCVIGKNTR
jgi:putative transposase